MRIRQPETVFIAMLTLAGCKAGTPSNAEKSMVSEIKHEMTIGGKDVQNPVPYTAEAAKEGGEHFRHHCQICHGLDGQATGVPFANRMAPPVADLSSKDVQDYADGQIKWIIENGIGPSGMPGWKGILNDEEMWNMVHYIRHLPPRGSLGAPEIFKEEAEEHEHAEHGEQAKPHTHKHAH